MNEIKACIIFFAGASIGAAVAWKLTCKHYEKIIDEEIESVKRVYSKDKMNTKSEKETKSTSDDFVTLVNDYSGVTNETKDDSPYEDNDIYRITEDEFIEGKPQYDKVTIYHYADGYFADDDNCLIEGGETVGHNTFDDIPEGFEDVLYVRNEYLSIDYEVIFSTECYGQTLKEEG